MHEHAHHSEQEHACPCHNHACGCAENRMEKAARHPLAFILGGILLILSFLPILPSPLAIASALIVYLWFGLPVLVGALHEIRRRNFFCELTLMATASLGALVIGEFAEGGAVVLLYHLGEMLSDRIADHARAHLKTALAMRDETVTVLRNGKWTRVSSAEIAIGETIALHVGERVAVDGVITDGHATFDTATITGESLPVDLSRGARVLSGYHLLSGEVTCIVDADADTCMVAQMEAAMQDASRQKSKHETALAKFVHIYTPLVFFAAFLVALIGSLATGAVAVWVKNGLMLLAVSCPCALVISVPLAYFAGCGTASARGCVIKGGAVIDSIANLSAMAFDKTGTLTTGKMQIALHPQNGDSTHLADLAAAVLLHSTHPLAVAFCKNYQTTQEAQSVTETIGGGTCGMVNGTMVVCGNADFLAANKIHLSVLPTTAIYVAADGVYLGAITFTDCAKPTAREAMQILHAAGVRHRMLLSGDHPEAVAALADTVGITQWRAALTPIEKTSAFASFCEVHRKDGTVGYLGDGLNDAAVIAGADVGFVMGRAGAALSVRAADVILMDEDLRRVADTITISRHTVRIVRQNIALAIGLKIGVLALCYTVLPLMGLAVFADVGVTLLAVANACRRAKI